MAFAMKIGSLKKYTDIANGVKIYAKDGKNYLEKDGKTFDLPSGNISLDGKKVYIDGNLVYTGNYVKPKEEH